MAQFTAEQLERRIASLRAYAQRYSLTLHSLGIGRNQYRHYLVLANDEYLEVSFSRHGHGGIHLHEDGHATTLRKVLLPWVQ